MTPADGRLRVAVAGAGFWARYQIAAWREVSGVDIVGITNRTRGRAEALAAEFDIPSVYDSAAAMLEDARPDALDIITAVETHRELVELAIQHRVAAICQKPFADSIADAEHMVEAAEASGVPLLVHENFRWQSTIRALKGVLDSGQIGTPFRARISFCSAFPVFENQPFLRHLERFILMDVGTHILDIARFLFGEGERVQCEISQVNPGIAGEDVATVMLRQGSVTTVCEMSFASRLERESFPQTLVLVEGSAGTAAVGAGYSLRVTTAAGTVSRRVRPIQYSWADPAYGVVHASIVACNRHVFEALTGKTEAESTGADNLKTLELVFASYASAAMDDREVRA